MPYFKFSLTALKPQSLVKDQENVFCDVESLHNSTSSFDNSFTRTSNNYDLFTHLSCFKRIRVAHLNCRSFVKNLDQLRSILASNPVHILSLNETRLSPDITDSEVELPGYSFIRRDRNREGGGVLLAIKEDLSFVKHDCNTDLDIEAVAIKVSIGSKHILFSSIYRPPSANICYYNNMVLYMEELVSSAYDTVFMGDFNLDISKRVDKVTEISNLLGAKQLVTKPTRVTQSTSSCIDLIFSTIPNHHIITDVVPLALSDHYMVFTVLNFRLLKTIKQTVFTRSFTNFNKQKFLSDLSKSSKLLSVSGIDNIEDAWSVFNHEYLKICNLHAPLIQHRINTTRKPSPWMTGDIMQLMHERDMLHKRATKSKKPVDWELYKSSRNNINILIRKRKKVLFLNKIFTDSSNKHHLWKSLETVLPSRKYGDNMVKETSPDSFNKFFTSVGVNLTKTLQSDNLPSIKANPPSSSFDLSPISSSFVFHALDSLPDKTGLDVINHSNALLKAAAPVISDILRDIFNKSIHSAIFPKDWKKALVTPIYKGKGSKCEPTNYRPISITSTISKIFESAINIQITNYLIVNNIITSHQSAYLSGRSTQTALHAIINYLTNSIDDGYITDLCALDMAKGFNTVSHKILLHKLSFYGFSTLCCNFFKSYLTDRSQKVKGFTSFSNELPINIGVPQGSILGPILFLIYINDLPNIFINCKCHLYADDTTIYCRAKTTHEAEKCLQSNLDRVSRWFQENQLVVNVSKSNIMLIGSKASTSNSSIVTSLNGQNLTHVSNIKLLGLQIDSVLNWKLHIDSIGNTLSSKVGLLHRLSRFVPQKLLIIIYTTLVQSVIDYALTLWGSCHKTYLKTLQRIQNRCARICTNNFDYKTSSSSLLKQLKWMDISTRYTYFTGILMY